MKTQVKKFLTYIFTKPIDTFVTELATQKKLHEHSQLFKIPKIHLNMNFILVYFFCQIMLH